MRPVAGEERVLADHRAGADGEQVGAHRHGPGEDHDAPADLRAQRPQVEQVQRGAGEQRTSGLALDQRLDDPEADVRQAPDADLPGLPPADQHPLGHDRQQCAGSEEQRAADDHRPQVGRRARRSRPRSSRSRRPRPVPASVGVPEEDQQLQRPAEDVLPGAGWRHRARPGPAAGPGATWHRTRPAPGRGRPERRGQAVDRGVLVDVLHRHRRQVGPLPHPGAELGHHQRVGAQVVEEVRCRPAPLDPHDAGQHLGERPLERAAVAGHWAGRPAAPPPGGYRGVLVDVLHRHRRQVVPLPHPGAELGHHQRVGTQVVEEVRIDRHPLDVHDARQHLGKGPREAGRRAGAPSLDD